MNAREVVLARVRRALADAPAGEAPSTLEVPRTYAEHERDGTLARFVERVSDYGAGITEVSAANVSSTIADAVEPPTSNGSSCPPTCRSRGCPTIWKRFTTSVSASAPWTRSAPPSRGCALAIAETGTLVFDAAAAQGRRALTLVPDFHLCVVEEAQVVDGVPAAIRRLASNLRKDRRPVTFVSGPSRPPTSSFPASKASTGRGGSRSS